MNILHCTVILLFFLSGCITDEKNESQHADNLAASNTYLMPTISLLYGDLPDVKNPWLERIAGILNPDDINNPLDKRTGKLEPGYDADVLILDKNPLENLENLKKIHILINNGKQINLEDLLSIPFDGNLSDGTIIYRKSFDPLIDSAARNLVYGMKKASGKEQKLLEEQRLTAQGKIGNQYGG